MKLKLHWQILIALILGILYGLFLTDYVTYVAWMGEVFLRLLKMIIVPIILTSIITGISNIGSGTRLQQLGFKTFTYYIASSLFAIVSGLVLVNLLKPGVGADLGFAKEVDGLAEGASSFKQTLIEIIPENIFSAFTNGDILPIIFFGILFGYFLTKLPSEKRIFLHNFFHISFEVIMKITMVIITLTPIGIFGIISEVIAEQASDTAGLIEIVKRLGMYMVTVITGLAIHACITIPILLIFIAKVNPLKHFKAVTNPLLTAFSTSSAGATLPLTMEAVEHNDGVPNKITSFTLPLGATINMDGTALYECVAAMFIAQAYGLELDFTQQVMVVVTALLASIGAAAIPMAGLVMITIVLSAIGLPLEGVGLIIAVDRILDMFRTSVNVWSDTSGTVIIAKLQGEKLKV